MSILGPLRSVLAFCSSMNLLSRVLSTSESLMSSLLFSFLIFLAADSSETRLKESSADSPLSLPLDFDGKNYF